MENKFCNCCITLKSIDLFGKDKHGRDGFTNYCKTCRNFLAREKAKSNPDGYKKRNEKSKQKRREYYQKQEVKDRVKNQELLKSYKISLKDYNVMISKQNGVCAICFKNELTARNKNLAVDHCHKTGIIRGLLCSNCNRAIGLLKDSVPIIKSALKYLGDSGD